MKYIVTAQLKGKFGNGMSHNGPLYDINPTVRDTVEAYSPEHAIEIYLGGWRKASDYLNMRAVEEDKFFSPVADDDCPF